MNIKDLKNFGTGSFVTPQPFRYKEGPSQFLKEEDKYPIGTLIGSIQSDDVYIITGYVMQMNYPVISTSSFNEPKIYKQEVHEMYHQGTGNYVRQTLDDSTMKYYFNVLHLGNKNETD